jgi:hypothetical protein
VLGFYTSWQLYVADFVRSARETIAACTSTRTTDSTGEYGRQMAVPKPSLDRSAPNLARDRRCAAEA